MAQTFQLADCEKQRAALLAAAKEVLDEAKETNAVLGIDKLPQLYQRLEAVINEAEGDA